MFDKLCRATRIWHDSDSNVVLLSRQTKFINYVKVFWLDCVLSGSSEENCYEASVNPELDSTLVRSPNQSCFPVVLQPNQIASNFSLARQKHDVRTGPKKLLEIFLNVSSNC